MERADTAGAAVLVAHGSPSDPVTQEAAVQALARAVAAELPGVWAVRAATLAADGALERVFDGLASGACVFPLFMSDGWFVGTALPRRLQALGRGGARILTPLGMLPAFHDLCAELVLAAIAAEGWRPDDTAVILAAHGSRRGEVPARRTREAAEAIASRAGVRSVQPGFVEQAPFLADTLRAAPPQALCLPFFAADAGHVTHDLPAAVAASGFRGPVLPAAGTAPGVVRIVARALCEIPRSDGS
ncbi:CbiX/SirB N-terminal domain-containing protein [Futiania mangrovi]|uniref:Cobalamin biosynthesis protein CbiX n=1 Tax=Futiania mangrovi TaxID=2959716 RepID=A0A9J6PAN6_9PROT|nr:CbiX/SirB N-terminal domain-containing protein [Futiania mangrovii]MCP1335497.1 hypothetical protein [Futiania mangrovii]